MGGKVEGRLERIGSQYGEGMVKLGGLTSLDVKKEREITKMGKKGKICENCGSEFASEVGWFQHVRGTILVLY